MLFHGAHTNLILNDYLFFFLAMKNKPVVLKMSRSPIMAGHVADQPTEHHLSDVYFWERSK